MGNSKLAFNHFKLTFSDWGNNSFSPEPIDQIHKKDPKEIMIDNAGSILKPLINEIISNPFELKAEARVINVPII